MYNIFRGIKHMKHNKKRTVSIIFFTVIVAALLTLSVLNIKYTDDVTKNSLIQNCVLRTLCSILVIGVCIFYGIKQSINPLKCNWTRSLLWCLPCLLVVLANFPYSALMSESATIDRADLLWLFIADCLLIGIYEEFLFRGLFQNIFDDFFKTSANGKILAIVATSATFALWHLFNLFSGASAGATLLQVGYSFLIGIMLSSVIVKTKNIWICVLLHFIFDIGGLLIPTLGHGNFQDIYFWIATIVCGTLCAIHIIIFLIRLSKNKDEA